MFIRTISILSGGRAGVVAFCLFPALLALPDSAAAQGSFTLSASSFSPVALGPEGTSASNITIGSVNGFAGTVNLSCQVSPTNLADPPACSVSPATVTPPATASATITTKIDTATVAYTITISGTAPSTAQTITLPPDSVTVLAVTPNFTISVTRPISPTSVPAGSGGQGVITVNPVNGYSTPPGDPGITLSCTSITPLVTVPPYCTFNPNPVTVSGTGSATSNITINTFGPVISSSVAPPRTFYALLLPVPMLALAGLGAAVGGKRFRKAWGLLGLVVLSAALFLMPACGNSGTTSTSTPNGVTPSNAYSFTVTGTDANGSIASNTDSTTSTNPTVTMTVTAPTN
jgi:hypothetical protein